MPEPSGVLEAVRAVVEEVAGKQLADEQPLLMTHAIDSLDVVEIVTLFEQRFRVKIEGAEITFDHFDSLAKMSAFIERKLQAEKIP